MEPTTKKILIIDDEPDLAQMVAFQFKSKGFDVKMATDGLAALEIVHHFKPDLIILDINMPRMGGIEFYSKICDGNNMPLYPVLVLTARANIQELFKGFDIDGFMIKPFEIEHLLQEAELIIKKRNRQHKHGAEGVIQAPRKICVIEHHQGDFDKITNLFLNAGYIVSAAKSATAAIELMVKEAPDIALVQLGLPDVAGDTLIQKLSQLCKTMEVKFVLYTRSDSKHLRPVMEKIGDKTDIIELVEYDYPKELLDRVDMLL